MLKLLSSRFLNRNILVNVDRNLIASIIRNNHEIAPNAFTGNAHHIKVNLMKLLQATATIQTRRTKPTFFQKLTEKSDLLDFIKHSNDFCIKKHNDADKQRGLSEDFGIGLSVLVADHYYKINWNTLAKIRRRRGSKPDINCFSQSNEKIVIEAKGATSARARTRQKSHALQQKIGAVFAQANIASCALLKEDSISDVDFSDPPFIPPEDARYEESLFRADHYARVFNMIGQKELSEYFNLMRQRIMYDKDFDEFKRKLNLFNKIRKRYIRLTLRARRYLGTVEKFDDDLFVFTGIHERLLHAFDFINFRDYKDDYFEEEENHFYLLSDGLCIALLKNIRFLEPQIRPEQIPYHYEAFSIVDFDHSRESTVVKYLLYLFERIGCKTQKEAPLDSKLRPDLLFTFEDKKIVVEVKRYLNSRNATFLLERLAQLATTKSYKILLITNSRLGPDIVQLFLSRNVALIERTALKEIIERKETLLNYIK